MTAAKKISIFTILCLALTAALLTVLLTALFLARYPLIVYAFNWSMKDSQVQLDRVEGLQIGWNSAEIAYLSLQIGSDIGSNSAPQILRGVSATYSLADAVITQLHIQQTSLSIPQFANTSPLPSARVKTPLLLSHLLTQAANLPINSITMDNISIDKQINNMNLSLTGSVNSRHLTMRHNSHRIEAQLESLNNDSFALTAQTKFDNRESINLIAQLHKQAAAYQLKISADVILADSILFFSPLLDLPETLDKISGRFHFQATSQIPNDLNSVLQQELAIKVHPKTQLKLAYHEKKEPASRLLLDVGFHTAPTLTVYAGDEPKLHLSKQAINVDIDNNSNAKLNIKASLALSAFTLAPHKILDTAVQIAAKTSTLSTSGHQLPNINIDSSLTVNNGKIQLDGVLKSDRERPLFNLAAAHDLSTHQGRSDITSLSLTFDKQANKLSNYFTHWPWAMDLQAGSLNLNAALNWQVSGEDFQLTGHVSQQLNQLSGFYQDIIFVDLSNEVNLNINALDHIVSTTPAPISLGELDMGMPIKDLSLLASLDTKQNHYKLQKLKARAFSGQIIVDDFVYRPSAETNPITVYIKAVDIEKILLLAASEGIECTGKIDGKFPITITKTGVKLEQGRITSVKPGGIFRYTLNNKPAAQLTLNDNIQTQLVNQILSNYHYDTLQANVNYSPAEDQLTLQVRMSGKNPDIGEGLGLPANFNPNIETNLLPIFKAHSASKSVADRLEAKLNNSRNNY